MNRKTFRKQQKAIRRRHAQKLFEAPALENVASVVASAATLDLSREQRRLLNQIDELAVDIIKIFHRASLKLMVEGLKSGTESTK